MQGRRGKVRANFLKWEEMLVMEVKRKSLKVLIKFVMRAYQT